MYIIKKINNPADILLKFIILILLMLAFLTSIAVSKELTVAIVQSDNKTIYNLTKRGIKKYLAEQDLDINYIEFSLSEKSPDTVFNKIIPEKPQAIFAVGTDALQKSTKYTNTIPVIGSVFVEPEIIKSKKNATGILMEIPAEVKIKQTRKVLPNLNKIGIIYSDQSVKYFNEFKEKTKNMQIHGIKLLNIKDLPEAYDKLLWKVGAFYMIPDASIYTPNTIKFTILRCLEANVGLVGLSESYTKSGALLSIDFDYEDIGAQSAEIFMDIINGQDVSQIPLKKVRKSKLSINLLTADKIGIDIPEKIIKSTQKIYGQ